MGNRPERRPSGRDEGRAALNAARLSSRSVRPSDRHPCDKSPPFPRECFFLSSQGWRLRVAHGSFQRVRSQSFFSWRLHPDTSHRENTSAQRAAAPPSALRQRWTRKFSCDRPTMTRRSNQRYARSDGEAAGGSMGVIELTRQVGAPRHESEGRCNHSRPQQAGDRMLKLCSLT